VEERRVELAVLNSLRASFRARQTVNADDLQACGAIIAVAAKYAPSIRCGRKSSLPSR